MYMLAASREVSGLTGTMQFVLHAHDLRED